MSAQMLHDFAHAIAAKLRTNLAANPEVQRGMAQGYRFSDLARRYGGKFHGPNVEHLSMPETDFHQMMGRVRASFPCAPAPPVAADPAGADRMQRTVPRTAQKAGTRGATPGGRLA